jgi:hypothetical protein
MRTDYSDLARAARGAEERSAALFKQWTVWLGLGSAGGVALLLTLIAHLCNPEFALRALLLSYISFVSGLCTAGFALFARSREENARSEHLANSHNREQYRQAAEVIPEIVSSPRHLAAPLNRGRDKVVADVNSSHEKAESAWVRVRRWGYLTKASQILAAVTFVVGVSWPAIHVSLGGKLAPAQCEPKR